MSLASAHRILLVDDEEDICLNLGDILSEQGYEVDYATSGPAALELVKRRVYDIALLDLKMPGMSGVELYRELKKLSAGTVALIVTAFATSATAAEAMGAGAWRVLSKPVDPAQLMGLLMEVVDQPLVLVVDDDQQLCSNLWELLRERGFRVHLAHDGGEALERLTERAFEVVLIDLKLPDRNGVELLQTVRNSNPTARTVLITGHREEMERMVDMAMTEGADAVCYKPFDVGHLLEEIQRLIHRGEGRSEEEAGSRRERVEHVGQEGS
jgi:DNA-binding response OmpR family regulator